MPRRVAFVGIDVSEEHVTSSVFQLLVTGNVPMSLILFTLMMEVMLSCESSVLKGANTITSQKVASS
jgi:hypothetical protein